MQCFRQNLDLFSAAWKYIRLLLLSYIILALLLHFSLQTTNNALWMQCKWEMNTRNGLQRKEIAVTSGKLAAICWLPFVKVVFSMRKPRSLSHHLATLATLATAASPAAAAAGCWLQWWLCHWCASVPLLHSMDTRHFAVVINLLSLPAMRQYYNIPQQ